ncbi:MAG: SRPBCC family protein [Armatimonadota bacterium]|nr:SRPBCC family protein [Armatimonadota bacterium]
MPVKVEGRRIIRAPVQKVFQLVSRLEALPRVTGLWLTAEAVERKNNTLTVRYSGYFAGLPVESVQRATLHPPNRIDFRQSRGNLKAFRGQYQFKPIEGDTEVVLTVEADVGIPLISEEAARLVLHAFVERSLEKFKLVAERDLPRAIARKTADGAAAREAETEEAETGEAEEAAPAAPEPAVPAAARNGEAAPRPAAARPDRPPPAAGPRTAGQPGGKRRRRRRRRSRRGLRDPGGPPPAASGGES